MPMQLVILALLASASILLFFPLNKRQGRLRESRFVERVPFLPVFILPYLALFPFVTFSIVTLLFYTPIAARLYVSLIFGGSIAALIWYFHPTSVSERPQVTPKGPFTRTVAWMYQHDARCNAFPSSHTYTALVCSYYLTYAFPLHTTLIWVLGSTIVSSTLFIKQHHLVDLVGGVVLATASIGFSYWILGSLA